MASASMNPLLWCLANSELVQDGGWTQYGFANWSNLGSTLDVSVLDDLIANAPSITQYELATMTSLSGEESL